MLKVNNKEARMTSKVSSPPPEYRPNKPNGILRYIGIFAP